MAASRSLTDRRDRWQSSNHQTPGIGDFAQLVLWVVASADAFLPFAHNTSPLNAVMLQVPGNQGNWWHFLAGFPFLLAYPMIWIRTRGIFSKKDVSPLQRNLLWSLIAFSLCGTLLVTIPFLLHLAGTSDWQRLAVVSLVLGITLVSAFIMRRRRIRFSQVRAVLISFDTAYLANAGLCLVVYSDALGDFHSRSGWFLTSVLVWPILFELVRLWIEVLMASNRRIDSEAV